MNKIILLGTLLAASFVYNVYQTTQVGKLSIIAKASETRESINDDNFRDAFISTSQRNDIELAKSQGRIEGILLVVSKQKLEESDYAQIWHDGYYRGLEQAKETKENSVDTNKSKDYIEKVPTEKEKK